MLSTQPVVRLFGILCSLAIVTAVISDLVVLPSFLMLSHDKMNPYRQTETDRSTRVRGMNVDRIPSTYLS